MFRFCFPLLAACIAILPWPLLAEDKVSYRGVVEALNRVDISAQIDSVVAGIHFEPGQTVGKGDLLFTLDATDFEQRLDAAEAATQKAIALYEEAQQNMDRNILLRDRGAVTDVRLLKSRAAVEITKAAMAEAQSRVEAAAIALARTRIKAPISGVISRPLVSVGSYAEAGRKGVLASIVQLDPVRIAYQIPYPDRLMALKVTDLTTIREYSETVALSIELAPGWTHPELAAPKFLSPDVDPETRSLTAWAVAANPTHTLRPGMAVTMHPLRDEIAPVADQ